MCLLQTLGIVVMMITTIPLDYDIVPYYDIIVNKLMIPLSLFSPRRRSGAFRQTQLPYPV